MGMEKREFQIDKQKAMTYLATRQAGELSKACLEGVLKFPAINGGDLARGRKAASSFLVGL